MRTAERRISPILSGTGMCYPIHAGALWALWERGYRFDRVGGVSGGALVAGLLAAGATPGPEMNDLVLRNMPWPNRLLDMSFWPITWGLIRGSRLMKRMRSIYPARFKDTQIPLTVGTVDLAAREMCLWSTDTTPDADLPAVIRASMAIPNVFTPVKLRGAYHVDGGVMANFPLDMWGDGSDVIGLRLHSDEFPSPVTNVLNMNEATLGCLMAAASKKHIEDAVYARTCVLRTNKSSMNFRLGEADALELIRAGRAQMDAWLDKEER